MKKGIVLGMSALLLLSACGTHSMTGAYMGSGIGRVVGSAIGDLSGGRRGYHMGTVIGTLGGLAAGAAIGAAVDAAEQRKVEKAIEQRQQRLGGYTNNHENSNSDDSGFDPAGRGDDRIMMDEAPAPAPTYSLSKGKDVEPTPEIVATFDGYKLHINPAIEIRHARVIDANEDGVLVRDEECYVTFDIINNSDKPLFDVQPTVIDVTNNKHVHISPNLNIETIHPHQGMRYTATIKGDHRLKDGEVVIRVAVAHANREIASQIKEFTIPTRKKAD